MYLLDFICFWLSLSMREMFSWNLIAIAPMSAFFTLGNFLFL
jgi:hypothetical protein